MNELLVQAISVLNEQKAVQLTDQALVAKEDPMELLACLQEGMGRVGKLFEQGEYFLSELVYSGAILKKLTERIEQHVRSVGLATPPAKKGLVVLGTVQGDVHDLGKNIVAMLLSGSGYEVRDLGVDVPCEKFVEQLQATGARVLGMSALLTTSFQGMKKVVELLSEKGMRSAVYVMIGGGIVDEASRSFVGADVQSRNGYEAVLLCDRFFGVSKQ